MSTRRYRPTACHLSIETWSLAGGTPCKSQRPAEELSSDHGGNSHTESKTELDAQESRRFRVSVLDASYPYLQVVILLFDMRKALWPRLTQCRVTVRGSRLNMALTLGFEDTRQVSPWEPWPTQESRKHT